MVWHVNRKSRGSSKKKAINIGLKMTVNTTVNDYLHLRVRSIGYKK